MSAFLSELTRIAKDLNNLHVNWALAGGLACSAYADPRTTKDIDIVIAVTGEEEAESIAQHLIDIGYQNKQLLMHVTPVFVLGIRLLVPTTKEYSVPLDLMFSSCGIEQEIVEQAKQIEILPDLHVPITSLAHLIAMKLLSQDDSDRVRDKSDIVSLISLATDEEFTKVREAIQLITQRGFNRNRNLSAELDLFLVRRK